MALRNGHSKVLSYRANFFRVVIEELSQAEYRLALSIAIANKTDPKELVKAYKGLS